MDAGLLPMLGAMLAAGLASGVHCVGMCGGIVAAFDSRRVVAIVPAGRTWTRRIAFNAGRVSTYAIAGAIAGAIGTAAYASDALPAQATLQVVASIVLVVIGLRLAGARRLLAPLEALGAPLWRRLQPAAARLMQAPGPAASFAAGLAWGWLPCAMVYAALAAAAFSGGPANGALAMAAFGLGTLPFLLAAGWLARRLQRWRLAVGGVVLGFGVYGLAHAGALGDGIRQGLLCL
ncbi:MAG: sulfite exporter TauE/SafE family protein [Betaproteobacteria bacterium]